MSVTALYTTNRRSLLGSIHHRRLVVAEQSLTQLRTVIANTIGGLRPSDVFVTSLSDTSIDATVLLGLIGSSPTSSTVAALVATDQFVPTSTRRPPAG